MGPSHGGWLDGAADGGFRGATPRSSGRSSACRSPEPRLTPPGSGIASSASRPPAGRWTGLHADADPPLKRLMDYAGLDPAHGPAALGQLQPDPPAAVDRCSSEMTRAVLCAPAEDAIDLAAESLAEGRRPRVLPRARSARAGRGPRGDRCGPGRGVASDHQYVGAAWTRARPRRPAPRHRPGRLVHAGTLHRR